MEGIIIRDGNIKNVLKDESEWYIPSSDLYLECINKILEAFYYKDITNTQMPNYFGFGSCTSFRRILKSFFTEEYYSKAWNLKFKHQLNTALTNGTFNLLSKNRPRDNNGKSIWDIKAKNTKCKSGNFILQNRLVNQKALETILKLYGTKFSANYWYRTEWNTNINSEFYVSDGVRYIHNQEVKLRGKLSYSKNCAYNYQGIMQYGYHSKAEDDTCKILSNLSLDYIREVVIKTGSHGTYRIDFYIPDLDIYLEIDGMHKYELINGKLVLNKYHLERERYIENKLHKSLIRIFSKDIKYYLSHKREFLDKIKQIKYPIIVK